MWRVNRDFDRLSSGPGSSSESTLPPSVPPSDATNHSLDIAFDNTSTMISQEGALAESDGSAKKRVVCLQGLLPGTR